MPESMRVAAPVATLERTLQPIADRTVSLFQRLSGWQVFLGTFAVLVALKLPVITLPASLDASWSVFPAAQTLSESGFDYPALLDEPGFWAGGPSAHGTSIVTFVTALALLVFGPGQLALVVLHLLHLAAAAYVVAAVYRLAATVMPRGAFLVPIALVATPLVFTQIGFVYLEVPLMALAVATASCWVSNRPGWATVWAIAAAGVKASGFAVVATLTLLMWIRGRQKDRPIAALVLTGGVLVTVLTAVTRDTPTGPVLDWSTITGFWGLHIDFMRLVPMTLVLAVIFVIAVLDWMMTSKGESRSELLSFASLFPFVFIAFHFAAPAAGQAVNLLPRYWVPAMPFMLLVLGALLSRKFDRAIAATLAAAYLIASVLGWWAIGLPHRSSGEFILGERSPAHADLIRLEDRAIDALVDTGATMIVHLNTFFRMTYTANGFVDEPIDGLLVFTDETVIDNIDELPGHVAWIDRRLDDPAGRLSVAFDDEWVVTKTTLGRGLFEVDIYEARRQAGSVGS